MNATGDPAKFIVIFAITISPQIFAYQCDLQGDDETIASEKFDVDEDGTVTDIDSGLTWMRCALGQKWNGITCLGQANSYSWQSATLAAKQLNNKGGYASFHDWRIPKLTELASIADNQCRNPRISLSLFPETPAAAFWTSDHKKGVEDIVYTLSFGNEGVSTRTTGELTHVRLVRGRD